MTPRQLPLHLPFRAAMGRDDFFVSDANAAAVAGVEAWADWPDGKMLLIGPKGAGKTHLAHVWAEMAGARVIDAMDVRDDDLPALSGVPGLAIEGAEWVSGDRDAETRLFHLHNAMAGRGAPLLITARRSPARWGMVLPDLASRMAQAGQLTLDAPDDALLSAVLVKLAQDRRLDLTPAQIAYAVARMERSFEAGARLVARIDALALADKAKAPTQRHVRQALSEVSDAPDAPDP